MEFWGRQEQGSSAGWCGEKQQEVKLLGSADSEQLQNFSNLWEPTVDTYRQKPVPSREQEKRKKKNKLVILQLIN